MKVCSSCRISKSKNDFSKNQWAKRSQRRCQECVVANVPPAKEENILQLPTGQVFCSEGLLDRVSRDEHGNATLDLNELLADPRDLCTNIECGMAATSTCSRCKSVAYCSKECQKKDWKRHKVTECLKKPSKQMVKLDMPDHINGEPTSTATQKMLEAMQQLALEKKQGKADTWKKDLNIDHVAHGNGASLDPNLLRHVIMTHYIQIASFAAVHIAKYPHLKGALFLFSKVNIMDLASQSKDAAKLDRMFILVWGCRYVAGETHHPAFSAPSLASKFLDKVTTLPQHMERACDKNSFPLVFCSDPSGGLIPDDVANALRPPKGVDMIDYIHDTPVFTCVSPVRFFDFDAMLDLGNSMPEMEGYCLNMDRGDDDPTS